MTAMWDFPDARKITTDRDLAFIGADLNVDTLVQAYLSGYFPMPIENTIGWFFPEKRGVLYVDDFHTSRSLEKSMKRFEITYNQKFSEIINLCAKIKRPHGWIDETMISAYEDLFRAGYANSVEVTENGKIVGGTYGVSIGKFYAGESMFHIATDASKAAIAFLAETKKAEGVELIDVQWLTPHLKSLGCVEISRSQYCDHLDKVNKAA